MQTANMETRKQSTWELLTFMNVFGSHCPEGHQNPPEKSGNTNVKRLKLSHTDRDSVNWDRREKNLKNYLVIPIWMNHVYS